MALPLLGTNGPLPVYRGGASHKIFWAHRILVTSSLDVQNFDDQILRGFWKYIFLAIRRVEFGDLLTSEFRASSDFEAMGY
ncbi:unnamed protein product [Rhizophagus irregularis]|nr:unnamed protein product [Rhizophagus irregularis]